MLPTCSSAQSFLAPAFSMFSLVTACEGLLMIFDFALGGIVTVGLLVYLVFALVRPERF